MIYTVIGILTIVLYIVFVSILQASLGLLRTLKIRLTIIILATFLRYFFDTNHLEDFGFVSLLLSPLIIIIELNRALSFLAIFALYYVFLKFVEIEERMNVSVYYVFLVNSGWALGFSFSAINLITIEIEANLAFISLFSAITNLLALILVCQLPEVGLSGTLTAGSSSQSDVMSGASQLSNSKKSIDGQTNNSMEN